MLENVKKIGDLKFKELLEEHSKIQLGNLTQPGNRNSSNSSLCRDLLCVGQETVRWDQLRRLVGRKADRKGICGQTPDPHSGQFSTIQQISQVLAKSDQVKLIRRFSSQNRMKLVFFPNNATHAFPTTGSKSDMQKRVLGQSGPNFT